MPELDVGRGLGAAYVFGYASLVALAEAFAVEGEELAPIAGRLRGFRRCWGAAMDNWDPANDHKHFLDPSTGERPRIRVAYLNVESSEGDAVNGLAIPVGPTRLATLDAREVNYARIEVSEAFEATAPVDEPSRLETPPPVFAYVGTAAAHERLRRGAAEQNVCVSSRYLADVRNAFAALGSDALAEFERTTPPPPFPERDLTRIWLR